MTALKELQMEQRIMELENKVAELEEVVAAMGRLMIADQPVVNVPNGITIRHHVDAIDYLKELGYHLVGGGVYVNSDKNVKAQIVLNDKFEYDIHFSRV